MRPVLRTRFVETSASLMNKSGRTHFKEMVDMTDNDADGKDKRVVHEMARRLDGDVCRAVVWDESFKKMLHCNQAM